MINLVPEPQSEDDIRSTIVVAWLADHGFTARDIAVERGFEIRLGRGVFRVDAGRLAVNKQANLVGTIARPRIDLLVKGQDRRNLLVIEVKKERDAFSDEEKEQAISYARLLKTGGMAPFVILTNGKHTQIFDTYTAQNIVGNSIPSTHPHVKAGFRISGDDLALRAEALETLISISSENLLAFCQGQVRHGMRRLRSEDIFSGKKYIPSLYVERGDARVALEKRLLDPESKVTLLIGPPQQGKTCLISRTAEQWLAADKPCLFYSAIGLQSGLGTEIKEDFVWTLGDASDLPRLISKLSRILERSNQRLIIFIDGWNELGPELALDIDRTLERVLSKSDNIAIVLSATNRTLSTLLLDPVGNPTFLADTLSLGMKTLKDLEIDPSRRIPGIIALGEFSIL